MARPGLTQHRKFLRLARVIGSAPLALGLLEFMWERCYQNGEPYLGDETDVEAAANWSGEPGALAKAFLEAGGTGNPGFIDEDPDWPGNYLCHDLFDHAPDYVAGRRKKEQERQKTKVCAGCGGIFHSPDLRGKFCTDACKQRDYRNRHSTENSNALPTVTDRSVTVTECYGNALPTVTDSYCTPAPAPKEQETVPAAPERPEKKPVKVKTPKIEKIKPEDESLDSILGGRDSQNYVRFWKFASIWPKDRNPGPKSLARAWNAACAKDEPVNIYHGALNYRDGFLPPRRDKDETQFMKAPLTWLQEEGWQAQLDTREVANA